MTPTRTIRKQEIKTNGHSNGLAKAPEAASNDSLQRELQALRRSEAVLRDFIETSTIGLHWVGADGTILWANQAELDLLGYVREQYIGRNITEFHADEGVINEILACLSRGEVLRDRPARLRHRDGSIRHVLINSSVLFEDGEFVHTRCFTRDITDLKQEQETRQTQLAAELADTKLLRDISAQLIEPGDEDALYAKIVDAVAAIMRSDFATMQVLYPERGAKGELRLLASRGLTPAGCKGWEWVRFDTDSTCGQVLRTGKRAIAADVEKCDFIAGTGGMAALLDAGIHAAQSTPLISRSGKMLGMISSHWSKPHAPTERDLRLLDILARQAADLIERRQAEQALRESERHLHEIIEAIPAAVYTTDADGRITFFNQAAVEFSGRVPEPGTDSWCVTWKLYKMDGTPLPHDQCPMAVALREKRPVLGCEAVAERPDGQRRIFTPYPTPLFDDQGRLTGAVNMLVDITERKRAEDILRESEERFRAIVETTPECVKVVAADGTLLLMNEAGLGMVGAAAAEDVTGRSVYDLIAPEDRQTYRAFNERVCGNEKGALEFDIVGLKGRRCRMETHAVPLRRPDGSIVQLGITRDVTGRRKAEETRLLLGAIVDSSDDAIISKDLDGQITSWNRGAERLYGYTPAEAIGKSILIVVPEDRHEEEREILARLQRGERVDHFETTRRRKDGAVLNVSLTISPLSNDHGEIIGVSKISRDITERKRAENELRRANQDLEQFAYSASHDLQEPLRTIKIYSELLAGSLGSVVEGESAEFLDFLQSAATRMELLVRDLLAYTQVTRLDAKLEEADANQTLAEALANLGGAIGESRAAITSDQLPVLRAHGTHLRQLFQNLIGNAIKYRSEDRTPVVHIGAERQDGFWVFTVRDNGIGIPPEFKEQIFGLFTRLHNADHYTGTGIGLAICQRIVERYHGRIWVESEPGRGSEFRFTLPV